MVAVFFGLRDREKFGCLGGYEMFVALIIMFLLPLKPAVPADGPGKALLTR